MRTLLLLCAVLFVPNWKIHAQISSSLVLSGAQTLGAACSAGSKFYGNLATGALVSCQSGVWALVGGGSGSLVFGNGLDRTGDTVTINELITPTRTLTQSGSDNVCTDTGPDDTYGCGLANPLSVYVPGMHMCLDVSTTNTGAATVNAGPGIVAIVDWLGNPLVNPVIQTDACNDLAFDGVSFRMAGHGTVASGTSALGTSAISANACATVVTTAAVGAISTDAIAVTPNADISSVTGYGVASTDGLIIYPYPTAGNVNYRVCNGTGTSITPGAVTLNWKVIR